jgi:hypothetical protein
MAKLKITKTEAGGQMHDRYTMATQIPAGTYVGGTGGFTAQTGRQIQPKVKVRGASATNGSIIAQKGAHKFQVSDETTIQDEDIVQGQEYRISSVSGTNWDQFGAGVNANTNDVFTAKIAGSAAVVDNGTVQNVATCTLVNKATPTAANTMSIVCTAANVSNANVANIGANTAGNRITAYVTWNAGDVVGGTANFKVGQTINLINGSLTGNLTISAINSSANLTVTTDTNQAIAANTTGFTATFQASKISNKYVWDFLDAGTAESSSTGGFTGAENPNRFRYHLAEPTDTFVKVNYA